MEFDLDAAREIAERECGAAMGDLKAKFWAYGAALIAQTYAAEDIAPAFEEKWEQLAVSREGLPPWGEIDDGSKLEILVKLGAKHVGHAMRRAGMAFDVDFSESLNSFLSYSAPEFEEVAKAGENAAPATATAYRLK